MLQTAIIVFREVFEIALVMGILVAATRGLVERGKWIGLGLGGGILGSLVVAGGTGMISNLAEGMGQELFNGILLILTSFLIGWTVVWMKRHGRSLTQKFKQVGDAILTGKKPLYTLAIVIALAVLREGSEIVLFIYGIAVSGQGVWDIVFGGFFGLITGVFVGFAIYYGLVKMSPKHLFSVTSWLLIFLAAGMVSQALHYLSAGGFVPEIISPIWDSSAWLPENGFLGRVLHALIGYSDRPSATQLIGYLFTFFVMVLVLKFFGNAPAVSGKQSSSMKTIVALFFLFSLGLFMDPAKALATQKIYSPSIEYGELELEYRGGYNFDDNEEKDGASKHKFAVGYGLTPWWFTEVYGELEKESGADTEFTVIELENRFQPFEQGQNWVDVGFYFAYEFGIEEDADKIEGKLLLEKQVDQFVHRVNLTLESKVNIDEAEDGEEAPEEELEGGVAYSFHYRWQEWFMPGVEWHSDFGSLEHSSSFDEQKHQLGPVIYGKVFGHVKYDVGVLFGMSEEAPDVALKWIVEYEIRF